MQISLAIVTYNNANIIENTIKSIVNNIPSDIEYKLFIIDNASNDNTLNIVRSIEGNIEIIQVGVNRGFGYGHNRAIDIIESKYHFVINPDIIIENSGQIKKMINFLENNNYVGMLSPLILNTDFSIQYLCKTNPTIVDMSLRRLSPNLFRKRQDKYTMKDTQYNKIMKIDYASGCFMVFRTELFKALQGFDEKFFMYLEDADITRRINNISSSVFFPDARVIHLWERGSYKKLKLTYIMLKSMIIYFNKWGWKVY